MRDIINATIGENHFLKCATYSIARNGEGLTPCLSISIPDGLLNYWAYIDFKKPNGETFVTPRIDVNEGKINYNIPCAVLDVEGELEVQVVFHNDEGAIWKSYVKAFAVRYSINASDDIPNKEDFITEAQKLLDDTEKTIDDFKTEINKELSNFYTKEETDDNFSTKAETDDVEKAIFDKVYTKEETDDLLSAKVNIPPSYSLIKEVVVGTDGLHLFDETGLNLRDILLIVTIPKSDVTNRIDGQIRCSNKTDGYLINLYTASALNNARDNIFIVGSELDSRGIRCNTFKKLERADKNSFDMSTAPTMNIAPAYYTNPEKFLTIDRIYMFVGNSDSKDSFPINTKISIYGVVANEDI